MHSNDRSGKPFISVIIPVYKTDPALFRGCLESVAVQSASEMGLETIVVFDGEPSADLESIVQEYANRTRLACKTISNQGVSAARNAGIDMARGTWLFFLDSDDMLAESALSALAVFAVTNHCDVVMGDHITLLSPDCIERHEYSSSNIEPSSRFAALLRHDVLRPKKAAGLVWGKLFRTSFLKNRNLKFDPSLAVGEDTDFVFRAVQLTNAIGYLHKVVYLYRRNAASTVMAFRGNYADRIILSMDAMKAQISALHNPREYERDFASYVLFHLMLILVHYLFNPSAPWSVRERRQQYKEMVGNPLFRDAFERYDPTAFSLTRRVSLFSLRHKLYFMSAAIAKVRRRQMGSK